MLCEIIVLEMAVRVCMGDNLRVMALALGGDRVIGSTDQQRE